MCVEHIVLHERSRALEPLVISRIGNSRDRSRCHVLVAAENRKETAEILLRHRLVERNAHGTFAERAEVHASPGCCREDLRRASSTELDTNRVEVLVVRNVEPEPAKALGEYRCEL